MASESVDTQRGEERVSPFFQSPQWAELLRQTVAGLIPPDSPDWEFHCAITRNNRGCTDVQFHVCIGKQEVELPQANPSGQGGLSLTKGTAARN